jgi:hypothetical protein
MKDIPHKERANAKCYYCVDTGYRVFFGNTINAWFFMYCNECTKGQALIKLDPFKLPQTNDDFRCITSPNRGKIKQYMQQAGIYDFRRLTK